MNKRYKRGVTLVEVLALAGGWVLCLGLLLGMWRANRRLRRALAERTEALESAQLEGVLLAVRTTQHGLRNALCAAYACAEIVADDPNVPEELRRLGAEAVSGTRRATDELEKLGQLSRIEERDWGPNSRSTIDLERSALAR